MKSSPSIQNQKLNRRSFQKTMSFAVLGAVSAKRVLGANDTVNVGVIGCGSRSYAHTNTLLRLKESGEKVKITAVCDVYAPRMQKAKEHTAAEFATMEHEELLEREDIDLVVVASPDHWHGYHTIDALKAGKDVYCEKPLCHWRQTDIPQRMIDASVQSGHFVQIGTQWMSNPAYAKARDLIRDGAIGQPIMAETGYYRVGDWGERGMPMDDPNAQPGEELNWRRFLGDSPIRPFDISRFFRWRMYWDYAGGPATDLYPHPFTPVAYMLDLDYPRTVVCTGGKYRYIEREVPDTCNMIIDYPEDFTALVNGTQGNDYSKQGSGTRPILRGWEATLTFEENEIVLRPTKGSSKKEQHIQVDFGERFTEFWSRFLTNCRNRHQPECGIELGAKVQIAMQMGVEALRNKRAVAYDPVQRRMI